PPPAATAPTTEHEARLQQREIEAAAVVRHEAVELPEHRLQCAQERRLLVEVAHEELPHLEVLTIEEAHADQEGVGAGAARQAGGLGVEIEEPAALGRRGACPAPQGA